ncbi:MAG: PorV/PorQ family protein [Fermentimonas sp.]|nr:PorV/PorQ family protein [Fermentimonas sp.]
MKNRMLILAFILMMVESVNGQSMQFLNLSVDARQSAMGNAGYVFANSFAVIQNMAVSMLDDTKPIQIGASYLSWQPSVSNSNNVSIAGLYKFKNFTLGAGLRHVKYSEELIVDNLGNSGSSEIRFLPVEYAIDMGMGYRINDMFMLGSTLRYVNSDLGAIQKASVFAVDLSLLYNKDNLSAGFGFTNLGTKADYGNGSNQLPLRLRTGLSYSVLSSDLHKIIGVADVSYQLVQGANGLIGGAGVEYGFKDFLFLRTGYHFEQENIGASYVTSGLGVSLRGVTLDFSYLIASKNNPVNQSAAVSLGWIF